MVQSIGLNPRFRCHHSKARAVRGFEWLIETRRSGASDTKMSVTCGSTVHGIRMQTSVAIPGHRSKFAGQETHSRCVNGRLVLFCRFKCRRRAFRPPSGRSLSWFAFSVAVAIAGRRSSDGRLRLVSRQGCTRRHAVLEEPRAENSPPFKTAQGDVWRSSSFYRDRKLQMKSLRLDLVVAGPQ